MQTIGNLFIDSDATINLALEEFLSFSGIEFAGLYFFKEADESTAYKYIEKGNKTSMLEANREKLNSFQMNYLEIFEKLQKGIPVTDTTRFFNDQNTIDNRIQSVIFLPIIIDSILWAYIFCINKDDYEWKAKDLSDLMELSYKITSALSRKKQILMLMKDEEHYTFLIENVTDVVVRVDENTVVKDIRGYVTKLSGYSSEDIVGKSLLEFLHEEDRMYLLNDAPSFRIARKSSELRFKIKTGEIRWARVNSCPVYEGEILKGYWCIITDIDDIKKEKEKVMASEELYRLLASNVQDVIWTTDFDFGLTYMSPSGEKYGWISRDDAGPIGLEEFLGSEQYRKIKDAMSNELEKDKHGSLDAESYKLFSYEMIKPGTKARIWIETKMSLARDAGGKPVGFMGVSRDSTERKRIEEAFIAVEARQRYLLDNIQDVLVCYDSNARISYVSDNIRQITGYSPSEIIGKSAGDFVSNDTKPQFAANLLRLQETKGGGVFEYKLINKDGDLHWYRLNSKPSIDEQGNLIEVVALMSNIDKYKEVEEDYANTEKKENLYQHIVGKMHDLVWASSLDFMTIYISPSIKASLGYSVNEAMGMEFGTTFKSESLNKVVALFREAKAAVAKGDCDWTGEISINQFKRNRRALKGILRMSILCDSQNIPYGYLGITSFRRRGPNVKDRKAVPSEGKRKTRGRPKGSRKSI